MPIYEYQCDKCGHEFEREQRISEAPLKTCPHCRAPKARRLISRTSFLLKGGGWYKDLYASKSPSSSTSADKSQQESPKDAKKKSPKEPKKAASKSEPKPSGKGPSGSRAAA